MGADATRSLDVDVARRLAFTREHRVREASGGVGPATHFAFHGLDPVPLWRKGYHYGLSLPEVVKARALWVFTNHERKGDKWERVQARWIGLKSMITRCQRVDDGWRLTGWAWGGDEPIERVEITTDGGATWQAAQLHAPGEYFGGDLPGESFEHAWSVFEFRWRDPAPGQHLLTSRAYAAGGVAQPMEEDPNVKGHFNQTRVKWRRVDVPG